MVKNKRKCPRSHITGNKILAGPSCFFTFCRIIHDKLCTVGNINTSALPDYLTVPLTSGCLPYKVSSVYVECVCNMLIIKLHGQRIKTKQ